MKGTAGWRQEVIQFSCVISESFSLTRKPADPTVVVEGVNGTQVQLVWNFTAASSSNFVVNIKRRRPTGSAPSQVASRTRFGGSSSNFTIPEPNNQLIYEANLPATLVIKNVTRYDEYVYSIEVLDLDAGAVEVLFDEVTVDVLCKSELVFVLFFQFNLRPITATTVPINLCRRQLSVFSTC